MHMHDLELQRRYDYNVQETDTYHRSCKPVTDTIVLSINTLRVIHPQNWTVELTATNAASYDERELTETSQQRQSTSHSV